MTYIFAALALLMLFASLCDSADHAKKLRDRRRK